MSKNMYELWVEKYRPQKLSEYIGNKHIKQKVSEWLKIGQIPHLLFSGVQGTGKTTIAKIIVNELGCDYMLLNASDENGVETIRTKVKEYASRKSFGKNGKVIIFDEFDYLSTNAQAILRNLMEVFHETCRFIATCNYPEKIIPALRSRFQKFDVEPPKKIDVLNRCEKILKTEDVKFERTDIVKLVKNLFPDIRDCIGTMQLNTIGGTYKLKKVNKDNYTDSVISVLKDTKMSGGDKFVKVKQAIVNSKQRTFDEMYTSLYNNLENYANGKEPYIMQTIAEGQYQSAMVVDKEINIMGTISKIIYQLNS